MIDDFDELMAIRDSGRWWDRPWWRDTLYQTEFNLRIEQIEPAFDALREVFNEEWGRKKIEHHPIIQELFGATGLCPFSFLYELGRGIKVLRDKGLLGDLARRLREADEFDGACAEVEALAQWVEAGIAVERNVPSGKGNRNCDWKVSNGESVIYGEVKRIQPARKNSERSALGEHIQGLVLECMGAAGIQGNFEMELLIRPSNLTEVWQFKKMAAEISDKVMRHLEANRGTADSGWQVVEGLVKYRHVPGQEPEGLHGAMGGIPYNMRDEGDKMMDVVEEAAGQLPSSGPGLVMISGSGKGAGVPFAHESGKRMADRFRAPESPCGHIAGVLILRMYLIPEYGLTRIAVYVQNPLGPRVDMDLLGRGFPNLVIWDENGEVVKS